MNEELITQLEDELVNTLPDDYKKVFREKHLQCHTVIDRTNNLRSLTVDMMIAILDEYTDKQLSDEEYSSQQLNYAKIYAQLN